MRTGISIKVMGSFAAGVFIATAILGWSLFTIERLTSTMQEAQRLSPRVEKTAELNFLTQKLLKTAGDYLVTGDIKKRDEFDKLIGEMSGIINFLDKEKGDERWRKISGRVKAGALELSEMTIGVMHTDQPAGNRRVAALMNEATILAEGLVRDVGESSRIASEDKDALVKEAEKFARGARMTFYLFPVVGGFLLFMLYRYLRDYITRPLMELHRDADRISSGDFSYRINVKTGDEIEELCEGFNRMAEYLSEREAKLKSLLKVVDKMNVELIAESQHKTAFLSNISHELKTPLTHILGFSELLKINAEAGKERVMRYAENIHTSGEELLRLVDSLLSVTRVISGRAAVSPDEFSVTDAVRGVVSAIGPDAEKKGQRFTVFVGEGVETIRADKAMFRQMLFNLLDNAVKYTPRGGSVELKVAREILDNKEKILRVRVRDTGMGIKPELKDVIFSFFEIGDTSFTREEGGMGVGLALAKRFVEFHGGKIWVESEPGAGSTFEFFIPAGSVEERTQA